MAVGSFIFVVFCYCFIFLFYYFFILFVFFILLFLCSVFKWLGERKRGKLNSHFKPIKITLYSPFLRTFEMFIKALWKVAFAFFPFVVAAVFFLEKNIVDDIEILPGNRFFALQPLWLEKLVLFWLGGILFKQ